MRNRKISGSKIFFCFHALRGNGINKITASRFFKNMHILWLSIWLCAVAPLPSMATQSAVAPELPKTTFSTGAYKNNQDLKADLAIPGAEALEVKVYGESEKKLDWLRVYFNQKRQHKEFSGTVNTTFIVPGGDITVTFHSDGRTTAKGLTVTIKQASPATIFNRIKQDIQDTVNNIATNGAEYAKKEIAGNIKVFRGLQAQLKNKNADDFVKQVSDGLLAVAQSYALISSMRKSIRERNAEQFDKLNELLQETRDNQTALRNRRASEETMRESLRQRLTKEKDLTEQKKAEISLKGTESILESLDIQAEIWQKFYDAQVKLRERLRAHEEKVDLLLHVLKVNADVYREAAYAIQLKRSMTLALQTFDDNLTNLRSVLEEIDNNWKRVTAVQTEIKQARFK